MEIVQGIHQIKVPLPEGTALDHMNIYLIEGTKGNLLIGTGLDTPEAFGALRDALRFSGFGFKDITLIVATHIHPDHYGLIREHVQPVYQFQGLSDVPFPGLMGQHHYGNRSL